MPVRTDLKELTLKKLKELAQKHIGAGHSKLKTKSELLQALKKVPQAISKALKSGAAKSARTAKVAEIETRARRAVAKGLKTPTKKVAAAKPSPKAKAKIQGKALAPRKKSAPRPPVKVEAPEETPTVGGRKRALLKTVKTKAKGTLALASRTRSKSELTAARRAVQAQVVRFEARPRRSEPVFGRVSEPLVEGFFVAWMAGVQEARIHPVVEEAVPTSFAPPPDPERLGDLPWAYGDDAEVALARDPRTLFYLWDFSSDTVQAAGEGLGGPRAVLVLLEAGRAVREVDFALESRSYYLHDLTPGQAYRVEAYFVGADGRRRRIGRGSNEVTLPPLGPSSDNTVRFMRVPWGQALARREAAEVEGTLHRYLTWQRVPLPNSGGFVERMHEWTLRDASAARDAAERNYLGSSFTGLGSSEQPGYYLGASERWSHGSQPSGRGGRA